MKTKINYSSSSDDDEPLIVKKEKKNDKNGLFSYSKQQCDFCDSIFYNTYDIFVHNSQHIIIPLIKQEIIKCAECKIYFSTHEEFDHHNETKHNITKVPALLESMFKIQPIIKCFDDLSELLNAKKEDEVPYLDNDDLAEIDLMKEEDAEAILEDDTWNAEVHASLANLVKVQPIVQCDNSVTELINSNIRSRITFEDDIDDDIISLNLTPYLPVDFETGDAFERLERDMSKRESPPNSKVIYFGSKVVNAQASVHYDDLIVPGHYGCKKCYQTFPNRYQAIIHETEHMKLKNIRRRLLVCAYCDRCIAGNYKTKLDHVSKHHPCVPETKKHACIKCKKCGLFYYNYKNHKKIYHCAYKCSCGQRFLNNYTLNEHQRKCRKEMLENGVDHPKVNERKFKIIKLCDICHKFKKYSSFAYKFVCVGELNEVGTRQRCVGCNKEYFNVKVVKYYKGRRKLDLNAKKKDKNTQSSKNRKIESSYENRLIHIQKKLKYMNKMTRF